MQLHGCLTIAQGVWNIQYFHLDGIKQIILMLNSLMKRIPLASCSIERRFLARCALSRYSSLPAEYQVFEYN